MGYQLYGVGMPILKVIDSTSTVTLSLTMANEIVEQNDVWYTEEAIRFTNINKKKKKRKCIQRLNGIIKVNVASTTVIDGIMYAYNKDGLYGWKVELQPFSDNSAFKIYIHFTEPIYPVNEDGKTSGNRSIVMKWEAEDANVDYSTIKKYS